VFTLTCVAWPLAALSLGSLIVRFAGLVKLGRWQRRLDRSVLVEVISAVHSCCMRNLPDKFLCCRRMRQPQQKPTEAVLQLKQKYGSARTVEASPKPPTTVYQRPFSFTRGFTIGAFQAEGAQTDPTEEFASIGSRQRSVLAEELARSSIISRQSAGDRDDSDDVLKAMRQRLESAASCRSPVTHALSPSNLQVQATTAAAAT